MDTSIRIPSFPRFPPNESWPVIHVAFSANLSQMPSAVQRFNGFVSPKSLPSPTSPDHCHSTNQSASSFDFPVPFRRATTTSPKQGPFVRYLLLTNVAPVVLLAIARTLQVFAKFPLHHNRTTFVRTSPNVNLTHPLPYLILPCSVLPDSVGRVGKVTGDGCFDESKRWAKKTFP